MGSFSLGHWLIVALVAAIIFGPKRLADLGKGLGEGIRSFKRGLENDDKPEPPRLPESERRDA